MITESKNNIIPKPFQSYILLKKHDNFTKTSKTTKLTNKIFQKKKLCITLLKMNNNQSKNTIKKQRGT